MKLLMLPHYDELGLDNGVGQVIYYYHKYLPQVGVEITTNRDDSFDISASHLGHYPQANIHFSHGLYWGDVSEQQHRTNAQIIEAIRHAKAIVVPSNFVAETFRRDFRIEPYIIPHGIEVDQWQHNFEQEGYVLWNKNRMTNVCNPQPVIELAKRFPNIQFLTTFCNESLPNVTVIGRMPFDEMKPLIQKCSIYLATAKETFGIGTLEALASGKPILGFAWGGTKDIVTHKKDGYLVNPYNYDALSEGLQFLLENDLSETCKKTALRYNWLQIAIQLKGVFNSVKG
jgi:glycosyltransferase involved in cell wall biosynthesis